MFTKEVLNNRFQNGCLAAMGTAPIVGLASYKVLEDLKLDRDMAKIAKFTILVSLVSGLVWSMFPAARRKPNEGDETAVRDAYAPRMLITISEHIKDAEDAYIAKLHKDQAEKKSGGVAILEPRKDSYSNYYRKDDPLDTEPVRMGYRDPLRTGSTYAAFRSSTLTGVSNSKPDIHKVLLQDEPDD